MSKNNYAIILAGGIGSRFWPLSRFIEPKQFLRICSTKTMFEETLQRTSGLFCSKHIYIATSKAYYTKVKKCKTIIDLPLKNFLLEPEGKNTLAPITFLTQRIYQKDPGAVIAVFPCDHIIKQQRLFLSTLEKAIEIAGRGRIVTLGISPSRPETGYGYIKVNSKFNNSQNTFKVQRFIEKPSLSKAKRFIRDKRYYWNSGIFVFKAEMMLGQIRRFAPDTYSVITRIKNKKNLENLWRKLPSVSIDYAVMQRTKEIVMVPARFGWLDMGSWQSICDVSPKDKNGNIFKCRYRHIDVGSKNILVWSDYRLVATVGLDNLAIIDTDDALLVCAKEKAQEVKRVVQLLPQKCRSI